MILTACAVIWVVLALTFGTLGLIATIYAACTGGVPRPRMDWLLAWAWEHQPRRRDFSAWERQPRHKAPGKLRGLLGRVRS